MTSSPPDGVTSNGRRAAIFAVVSLALLMSSLDQTIVATALDAIQQGMDASLAWAGWTISAYSLGLLVMLPVAGSLSDQFGRRRVFLVSVAVFTAASLACGLANDIYVLVACRAVQAAGGAGFTPAATGIVVEHFGSARDKAVGLFGSIFPIGATIGPVVGGILVTYFSWRSVFLVNVPIGIALIPLALAVIPPDTVTARRPDTRLDFAGMGILGLGVFSGMMGLTYLENAGSRTWYVVAALVAAVLLLAGFIAHIRRAPRPFLAPRLIYGRGFGAVNVINIVYGGAVAGLIALVPLYVITRFDMDSLRAGTVLAAEGIGVIIMSTGAAFLLRRTGYRWPLYIGGFIVAVGLAAMGVAPIGSSPYAWVATAAAVVGIGLGLSGPASRNACLQLAPQAASSLAALRTMGRMTGTILAVSVSTTVIAASADPAHTHAHVYWVAAAVLLLALPVVHRVPEHRGAW